MLQVQSLAGPLRDIHRAVENVQNKLTGRNIVSSEVLKLGLRQISGLCVLGFFFFFCV